MKIAIIDPSIFTLPYDESLCLALQDQGHEVTLYGRPLRADEPRHRPELSYAPLFYAQGIATDDVWEPLRLGMKAADHVLSSARLFQHLDSVRPDIIHFQWTPFPAFDAHMLPRLARLAPLVLTVHDTRPFNDRPSSLLQRVGARRIYDGFCRLIVHTQAGLERLVAQGVPRARLACIPHGPLGDSPGRPQSGALSEASAPLNVLLIGKLKPYKGADVLIRAASLLPPSLRSRARFVIAGEPYMDATTLQELARELGVADTFDFDLRFLPDEALTSYFMRAAILAFPYREIEASGVFFAALSYGKPMIATRLGCFAELLGHEVHGLLVPPDDPSALSDALARLISEEATRLRMGEAAAALRRSIPTWEEIATRTLALYHHAIAERRRGSDAQLRPVA
jgi:glycosyltransferase involved in cell wall biosynthesis